MSMPYPIKVAALYRFATFECPEELRPLVLDVCVKHAIKGTILLAKEGINGTIAGTAEGIDATVAFLKALDGCAELDVKYSHAAEMPFYRMKVRVKKEIVTLGVDGIDPKREVGTYVQPEDWNALISDPEVVLIDTRNDYEVELGTFERAIDPKLQTFSQLPAWVDEANALKAVDESRIGAAVVAEGEHLLVHQRLRAGADNRPSGAATPPP